MVEPESNSVVVVYGEGDAVDAVAWAVDGPGAVAYPAAGADDGGEFLFSCLHVYFNPELGQRAVIEPDGDEAAAPGHHADAADPVAWAVDFAGRIANPPAGHTAAGVFSEHFFFDSS